MFRSLSLVAVRLFAIFFFMKNAYFIPLLMHYTGEYGSGNIELHSLTTAMNLFICIFLFIRPQVLLIGLKLSNENDEAKLRDFSTVIQSVGISLIGLFFLLDGLQELLSAYILSLDRNYGHVFGISENFLSSAIGVVGGCILIGSSTNISRLITWLREVRPRLDRD